ncbi:uncharacterized protein LOC108921646 isoform X1 [Arapaima gigas]
MFSEICGHRRFCWALSGCVNDGSWKLIFGKGTSLLVESKIDSEPSYYQLNDGETKACMATGFSKYDAVDKKKSFNDSSTNPTRIDGEKYFDKVILKWNDGDCDPAEGEGAAHTTYLFMILSYFPLDEKLNFLSLTVLGLRALFLKSVVFNVIMTLYMWIS